MIYKNVSLMEHLPRQKRGLAVGKTKRGKGVKIMAITDSFGIPVALHATSASPHEVTLVECTLEALFFDEIPEKFIGDKIYDNNKLDEKFV